MQYVCLSGCYLWRLYVATSPASILYYVSNLEEKTYFDKCIIIFQTRNMNLSQLSTKIIVKIVLHVRKWRSLYVGTPKHSLLTSPTHVQLNTHTRAEGCTSQYTPITSTHFCVTHSSQPHLNVIMSGKTFNSFSGNNIPTFFCQPKASRWTHVYTK